METLPALRFCAEIVALREATDSERRCQWEIRKKVLDWSISVLGREHMGDPPAVALTADERQWLLSTHPLLRPASTVALPAYQPAAGWREALSGRVRKYVEALQSRQ
jgi:hypothetical protein